MNDTDSTEKERSARSVERILRRTSRNVVARDLAEFGFGRIWMVLLVVAAAIFKRLAPIEASIRTSHLGKGGGDNG